MADHYFTTTSSSRLIRLSINGCRFDEVGRFRIYESETKDSTTTSPYGLDIWQSIYSNKRFRLLERVPYQSIENISRPAHFFSIRNYLINLNPVNYTGAITPRRQRRGPDVFVRASSDLLFLYSIRRGYLSYLLMVVVVTGALSRMQTATRFQLSSSNMWPIP